MARSDKADVDKSHNGNVVHFTAQIAWCC